MTIVAAGVVYGPESCLTYLADYFVSHDLIFLADYFVSHALTYLADYFVSHDLPCGLFCVS